MNKTNKNCNLKNFFKGFISFGNLSFINHKSNQINKFNNIDYNFNNVASIISKNFNKLLKNILIFENIYSYACFCDYCVQCYIQLHACSYNGHS